MKYQVIVLDLDGTLTNSKKEITPPTRDALIEIQQNGKKVVLASGRPINGVAPLAEELYLKEYGGFMLSFNGARITRCSDNAIIYNKVIPQEVIRPIYEAVKEYPGLDLISYTDKVILSGIKSNEYTEKEAAINSMDICPVEDFPAALDFPVNKMLIPGEPSILEDLMPKLQKQYHGLLNIYRSEPFFLEIMPQNIDKAHSLQKLLNSIGLTADSMICCGDGFNDLSMIEYAGLGVAMENAQDSSRCKSLHERLGLLSGSCARITAANTRAHPKSSLGDKVSPRITQPASTENTDSRLNSRDATVGSVFFCATICKVYPTPQDMIPA